MPETPRWWNLGVGVAVAIIVLAVVVALVGAFVGWVLFHDFGFPPDSPRHQ